MTSPKPLPYEGIRVVEFTHMVMGPTCGMVLADMGAEVIKVEPVGHGREGDSTRQLIGSGAGFFPLFNRNKKSLALDLQTPEGKEAALRLIATADIVTDHRTALDEVVQMMGGLAYMTGRPGDPLRAGSSVNDIMGGMFGAMGAMAALAQRAQTGVGQEVQSALFENNVLLVAQHMLQYQVTGHAAKPMPSRISAWAIYDVFEVKDGEQIFLAVVSDTAWKIFCEVFDYADLLSDERLTTNNARVAQRDWLIPLLRERLRAHSSKHLSDLFEKNSLPYAPITPPHELLDDEHLKATGGLAPLALSDGREIQTVLLPVTMDQERLKVRSGVPSLGQHNADILLSLGYSADEVKKFNQAFTSSPSNSSVKG